MAGYGEIWSTRLLAAYLEQQRRDDPVGRDVHWVDAREIVVVEHSELGPGVQWERSAELVAEKFPRNESAIAIVTGFIAREPDGKQTTLGRNGSDFSASIIGWLLDAGSITIWTDVSGVKSADPRRVPEAAEIAELTYNEAMELAYFGAKVIHPQTMSPAVAKNIPIYIKNTFRPDDRGSCISSTADEGPDIKGITTVENVALVNLEGTGMIGVPGTADRLFRRAPRVRYLSHPDFAGEFRAFHLFCRARLNGRRGRRRRARSLCRGARTEPDSERRCAHRLQHYRGRRATAWPVRQVSRRAFSARWAMRVSTYARSRRARRNATYRP